MGAGQVDRTPNAAKDTMTRIQRPDPEVPLQVPGEYRRRATRAPRREDRYAGGPSAGGPRQESQLEGGGAPRYRTPSHPPGLGTRLFNWLLRTA